MGWRVLIGEGSDQLVIDAHARFEWAVGKNINQQGSVESVNHTIVLEGSVVEASPALVADRFFLLSNEVDSKFNNVRVQLELDGSNKADLQPSNGFDGPHVTGFRSIPSDGNADSHWMYEMTIIFNSKVGAGGDTQKPEVYNLNTSLNIVKDNERTIRKIWKASATAADAGAAKAAIIGFKPASKNLREEVEVFPQEARATAIWVWEGLQEVFEEVEFTGGGSDYVVDPQAGKGKDAILHLAQRGAVIVTIRGVVRGFSKALSRPAPHFSESATLRRATARERRNDADPRIENAERGIWSLPFEEVWLSVGPTPNPNHQGQHNDIKFVPRVPADGSIGV